MEIASMTTVRGGSEPATELVAERLPAHIDRLYRAAYALSGSREDAEDLVQDTFARVLARPRLIRREHDLRYLMRALRNTWINSRRTRAARPVTTGVEPGDQVVDRGADPEVALEAGLALAAIGELSPKLRETIVAVDVLGLSYRQAASALRIRQGTVMSRLARARDRVAAALA
jgi:RNA polymerase sigma-70 factor (ECF subfamily)